MRATSVVPVETWLQKKSIVSHFSAHHSAETTGNSEIEIREEAFSFFYFTRLTQRDGWQYQIGWIFVKVPKGGSFSIQKIYVADFGPLNRAF